MFYSQTYLARKGPLSTVWIAAHLQHRLKKSHYTSTDIPSTVQRIMDPGVPIALRMSGHLLLGVVRIYSKKVDILFHDCNAVLNGLSNAFASIQHTLPEDAGQAPFQSITRPETFDLDAIVLDDEIDHDRVEDVHVKSQEDITLPDRIPIQMDHYVAISFDEDMMVDSSSHTEVQPDSGVTPMEEDIIHNSPIANVVGVQHPDPSTPGELPSIGVDHPPNVHNPEATNGLGSSDNHPPQETEVMPIEIRRGANYDAVQENPNMFPFLEVGDNDAEPNRDFGQATNEKDHTPESVDVSDPEGIFVKHRQPCGPSTPVTSQGAASDAQVFGEYNSPNLVLRESPPIPQPQRRGRKRKQLFDESLVLTNRFMRRALNNTRDILRKKKEVPLSTLDVWKSNISRMKEHIFYQPLLTGFCKDLLNLSKDEYIRSRPHLVISEEDNADGGIAQTFSTHPTPPEAEEQTATTPPVDVSEMEIEVLRNAVVTSPPPIPPPEVDIEPNIGVDNRSPANSHLMTDIEIESVQTPNFAAASGFCGSETKTPVTYTGDTSQNIGFSDTHHLINSAETEELCFLEVENNTPTSSQGTSSSINTLSVRTRAVAEYLKRRSPITPIMEDVPGDLSLNEILGGKTRKLSARMFFEVLVLKTHGLIDVQQKEPYGDVSLKLTPSLSNAQI